MMQLLPRYALYELLDRVCMRDVLCLRSVSHALGNAVDKYVLHSQRGRQFLLSRVAPRLRGPPSPYWPMVRTYLDMSFATKFPPQRRFEVYWRMLRRACPNRHCLLPVTQPERPSECPHNTDYIVRLCRALRWDVHCLKRDATYRGIFDKAQVLLIKEEARRRKCNGLLHECISLQKLWRRFDPPSTL